jgi:hypothetical protein
MSYPLQMVRAAAALAVFGFLAIAPGAQAQTAGTDPNQAPRVNAGEGFGSADTNPNSFGGGINPFDLIHRATLLNGTSMEDFSRLQRGHISNEAANFRQLQQEAIQRQQAQPVEPSGEAE